MYLLYARHCTVLGAGETAMKDTDKVPALRTYRIYVPEEPGRE